MCVKMEPSVFWKGSVCAVKCVWCTSVSTCEPPAQSGDAARPRPAVQGPCSRRRLVPALACAYRSGWGSDAGVALAVQRVIVGTPRSVVLSPGTDVSCVYKDTATRVLSVSCGGECASFLRVYASIMGQLCVQL